QPQGLPLLSPGGHCKLVVTPQQPVVQYGGSAQLNCSLPCAGGTVQWKGLDTNLGSITSFPTHSILHISSAVVAMGGTKICHGTCHGQHYQQAVNLKVYALPDTLQLDTEPHALEPGQPATLHCSAQQVYPLTGLALTWYRGDQALGEADFESVETEEELFDITATLPGLFAITRPTGVFADGDSSDPAIAAGTTVSLLGLIATGVVSHRLWKRFRSQYELP
uniref:Ig-like domain-containing protein n=1 Tax=Calidris pygmaea TaxID=425635 RepID=A0A8C3K761_9CHAR